MRVLFLFVKGLFAKNGVINELGFGYIFYWCSVVGNITYLKNTKIGGAML